jgi:restriction system protein
MKLEASAGQGRQYVAEPVRTPGGLEATERLVTIPVFPLYSKSRSLLGTLDGVRKADFSHLLNSIWDQTGTPQDPVDWTEPRKWIPERLPREDQALATRIWEESGHTLNPRHLRGPGFLINGYELALPDASGVYRITPTGRKFLAEDPETLRQIDRHEGLLQLLAILAPKARAKRADLLPAWSEFLYSNSNYRTDTTISYTLYGRIANLIERGFVDRYGNTYAITGKGIDYASHAPATKQDPKREVLKALAAHNAEQRAALKEGLIKMKPRRFEALAGQLLLAMGYEDVEVTKASGDLGVDVKARMEIGHYYRDRGCPGQASDCRHRAAGGRSVARRTPAPRRDPRNDHDPWQVQSRMRGSRDVSGGCADHPHRRRAVARPAHRPQPRHYQTAGGDLRARRVVLHRGVR